MSNGPDVLIIGAGLAGLACARHLADAGVSFEVIEASDGIGGREEFSATTVLKPDGTLVGALTSTTSNNLTWRAVRTAGRRSPPGALAIRTDKRTSLNPYRVGLFHFLLTVAAD